MEDLTTGMTMMGVERRGGGNDGGGGDGVGGREQGGGTLESQLKHLHLAPQTEDASEGENL